MKPIIGIGTDISSVSGSERDHSFAYLTYVEAVRSNGGVPLLIPPQPENVEELLERLDGVLLAGGDDCDPSVYGEEMHPTVAPMDLRRQQNDLKLAKLTRSERIPTLGICLGMQVMNVAGGGTLIQDIRSAIDTDVVHESGPSARVNHSVQIEKGSRLSEIIGETSLDVNSSHHQAIGRTAEGLDVVAKAPDKIVEALEDRSHPFYVGVQWHPEDMSTETSARRLFGAFIEAARARARNRVENGVPVL